MWIRYILTLKSVNNNLRFLLVPSVSDLSSINEAYSRQKDRKVGLYLSVSSGIIHANFTSQKKGVFGWSRYSTTYHAKVNLRGFEFAQGELLGMVQCM